VSDRLAGLKVPAALLPRAAAVVEVVADDREVRVLSREVMSKSGKDKADPASNKVVRPAGKYRRSPTTLSRGH